MRRLTSKMFDISEFDEVTNGRTSLFKENFMSEESRAFEGWVIVELMGRNMIAGFASEQVIAGVAMLRVDVPKIGEQSSFTKLFGGSAIYAITPTTEEVATAAASSVLVRPVQEWVVPNPARRLVDSQADYDSDDFVGEL